MMSFISLVNENDEFICLVDYNGVSLRGWLLKMRSITCLVAENDEFYKHVLMKMMSLISLANKSEELVDKNEEINKSGQ
jgi:hypothetical protein